LPEGWSFLTGSEKDIVTIADAVGFRYTYDAKHDQYNHAAAAIFISPKGRITRYLYEVGFVGETLKMALVEAGEGRIGSTLDAFVLWCSHYDANENRYSASARRLLSVFAGIFLTMGLTAMVPFWLTGRKEKALAKDKSAQGEAISPTSPG
jgi:protein SCO1/2